MGSKMTPRPYLHNIFYARRRVNLNLNNRNLTVTYLSIYVFYDVIYLKRKLCKSVVFSLFYVLLRLCVRLVYGTCVSSWYSG